MFVIAVLISLALVSSGTTRRGSPNRAPKEFTLAVCRNVFGSVTCQGNYTSRAYYYQPDNQWFSGCVNTEAQTNALSGNTLSGSFSKLGAVLNISVANNIAWVLVGGACGSGIGQFVSSGVGPDNDVVVNQSSDIIQGIGTQLTSTRFFCEGFWLISATPGIMLDSNLVVGVDVASGVTHLSCSTPYPSSYSPMVNGVVEMNEYPGCAESKPILAVYNLYGAAATIDYGVCGSGVESGSVTVYGYGVQLASVPLLKNCTGYWIPGSDMRVETNYAPLPPSYPLVETWSFSRSFYMQYGQQTGECIQNGVLMLDGCGVASNLTPAPGVTYQFTWPTGCNGPTTATSNAQGVMAFSYTCDSTVVDSEPLTEIPISFGPDVMHMEFLTGI